MAIYNLNDLYRYVFNYVAPPYPIGGIPDPMNLLPIKKAPDAALLGFPSDEEPKKMNGEFVQDSMLGAELRMPTALRIPGKQAWFQLPNEPIISLIGKKEVVVTPVIRSRNEQGKLLRGTVKEEMYLDDYTISVRGIAYNTEEDDYPEDVMRQIRLHTEHAGALEIKNYLLNHIFNINLAVVNSYRYPRNEEMPFRGQAYEIGLLSDENFELEL